MEIKGKLWANSRRNRCKLRKLSLLTKKGFLLKLWKDFGGIVNDRIWLSGSLAIGQNHLLVIAKLFWVYRELDVTLDNIVGTHSLSLTLRECFTHKYLQTNFAHCGLEKTVNRLDCLSI